MENKQTARRTSLARNEDLNGIYNLMRFLRQSAAEREGASRLVTGVTSGLDTEEKEGKEGKIERNGRRRERSPINIVVDGVRVDTALVISIGFVRFAPKKVLHTAFISRPYIDDLDGYDRNDNDDDGKGNNGNFDENNDVKVYTALVDSAFVVGDEYGEALYSSAS
uniref:Uncharacterized protein n=1 Tax=Tetranychus urticae TaxID=32264 RepID=T1KXK9_TETUR